MGQRKVLPLGHCRLFRFGMGVVQSGHGVWTEGGPGGMAWILDTLNSPTGIIPSAERGALPLRADFH